MPENALLSRSAPVELPDWEKSAAVDCELPSGEPYVEYAWTLPAPPASVWTESTKILIYAINDNNKHKLGCLY